MNAITQEALNNLVQLLSNRPGTKLIQSTSPEYEEARLIYNRMHDYYPALIVRTLNIDDLRTIMAFAFKHHIVLAIRGGGHHIGGFGTCHHGIVIDFSVFKAIHVDTQKQIASVSPGVCLGDIDNVLSNLGYVLPTGTVSKTGLAGLTLGGGIGWLIGQYGLTCDQLCGADVLLADGRLVKAEDPEHVDLLWGLRGGGGNFGVVTTFRYHLNPLPKTICGMGIVAWEHAADVMNHLIQYLSTLCPRSLTVAPVFIKDNDNNPKLRIDFCCANGCDDDIAALLSLSSFISWSHVKEWVFSEWQKEFDEAFLPPMRGYWKAAYLQTITFDIIASLCHSFENSPIAHCSILFEHLHGAFKEYNQSTSAFPLRQANFGILLSIRWEDENCDKANINWIKDTFQSIDPRGTSDTYLNYTSADDQRAITTLLSNASERIAHVKSHYDPLNYFQRNHNVKPS